MLTTCGVTALLTATNASLSDVTSPLGLTGARSAPSFTSPSPAKPSCTPPKFVTSSAPAITQMIISAPMSSVCFLDITFLTSIELNAVLSFCSRSDDAYGVAVRLPPIRAPVDGVTQYLPDRDVLMQPSISSHSSSLSRHSDVAILRRDSAQRQQGRREVRSLRRSQSSPSTLQRPTTFEA